MPVIHTRFLGPTNSRGSRIKASAHSYVRGQSVTLTLGWDHALNPSLNHHRAAEALAQREGWVGDWINIDDVDGGGLYIRTLEAHEAFTIRD